MEFEDIKKRFDLLRFGYVTVSKEVAEKGLPIGYMCRDEPLGYEDSGWCFFSGNESDEYCENADNFEIWDIRSILNLNASIMLYLDCEIGTKIYLPKVTKPTPRFVTTQEQKTPS